MPITQSIQRQGLQLQGVQLQATEAVQGAVGAVAVDDSALARRQAIGQFLQGAIGGFAEQAKVYGAKAAVQGALDAQNAVDLEAERDAKVKDQNIFLRDSYREGYTSAAVSRELADWRSGALQRANSAAAQGLTDDEFRLQEQQNTAKFSDQISKWLPQLDRQAAVATLDQVRTASAANYAAFQEGRAKIAQQKADATLDENLSASGREFFSHVQGGNIPAGDAAVVSGMSAILGASHLDKDKKFAKVQDYLVSIAQNATDPLVIDRIQRIATEQLGVNSVDVVKALRTEFNRAGSQMEAQVRFDIADQLEALRSASPEQQEVALQNIRSQVQQYGRSGVLSTGTQLDIWNSATKLRDDAADKYALNNAIQNRQPAAVLAGAFEGDVEKAQKFIQNQFPDTPVGNAALLQYGKSAKDAGLIQEANKRTSKLMGNTLASLDSLGEDGTISADNNAAIAAWIQQYNTGGDIDKISLSGDVPEEYRGIIQRAASQGVANASGIILDDIRRLARNKASGRYDNLSPNPSDAVLDAESTANWFSFGDTADAQRAEGRVALGEEYKQLYRSNPELLVGKSPEDINTLLKGRIQSRQLQVEVSGKPRHVYLPAGTSLQDVMGSYKGDAEQFKTALSQQIQTSVDAVADPSKVARVIVQAGTAGAQGQNLTASVITTDGLYQNVSIDVQQVQQLAQRGYDEALAGGIKIGQQAVGARPATFWDADNGRTISTTVNGKNSAGVEPSLFSDIIATTVQFEGYRATKKKGSVGFGLHDNSGFPVPESLTPDQAVDVLKGSMEKQYIPNARKQLGSTTKDPSALKLLVDLNYHGGNGSSGPVAQELAKLKTAGKSQGSASYGYQQDPFQSQALIGLDTLKKQPAYKQAQAQRKKYLETQYWQSVQAIRLGQ